VLPELGNSYGKATKLNEYPVTGSGVTEGVGSGVAVASGVGEDPGEDVT
jgi:hypothetical protein